MKKTFIFLITILLILLTSCTNLNVIVNDSGDCVLDGIYYNKIFDDGYVMVEPLHSIGYTITAYGIRRKLYMSDLDLNNNIIYDQDYGLIWLKEGCELPTIYNSDILGFCIKKIRITPYKLSVLNEASKKISKCSINNIISETDIQTDAFINDDNLDLSKGMICYHLYLSLSEYLYYCFYDTYVDTNNIYIIHNEKTYIVDDEFKELIFNLIINFE